MGYRVKLLQWDVKTQRCLAKTTNLKKQSATLINSQVQQYEDSLEDIFKAYKLKRIIPSPEEVRVRFNEAAGRSEKIIESRDKILIHPFDEFTREMGKHNNWTKATYAKFQAVRKHLTSYNASLKFTDHTEAGLSGYVSYLRDVKQMRNITIGKQLGFLKGFLRWATVNGTCQALDYVTFKPKLRTTEKKIIFSGLEHIDVGLQS